MIRIRRSRRNYMSSMMSTAQSTKLQDTKPLSIKSLSFGSLSTNSRARRSTEAIATQAAPTKPLREKIGISQWFHYEAYDDVLNTIELLQDLGVKHLRTGISWADFERPGGKAWYDWQMETLHNAGLHILLSVGHVPPSKSVGDAPNSPPRRLLDYADFIGQVITLYGEQFHELELWNEPNNVYQWDFEEHDPQWVQFGRMIGNAAYWAKAHGRTTVLGGMLPVDHTWLELMHSYGVLSYIDVVAIHGFPGMEQSDAPDWAKWGQHQPWRGWEGQVNYIAEYSGERPVWLTETGLATWDSSSHCHGHYALQVKMLEQAAAAPVERVYWSSVLDLAPHRAGIQGFHVDESEYHMGLVTYDGEKKPAYYRFQELLTPSTPSFDSDELVRVDAAQVSRNSRVAS